MTDIQINKNAGIKIYLQIRNRIIYGISTNNIVAGERLPSVRKLAGDLGVAVATVRHAYDQLKKDGFVNGSAGKGIFVRDLEKRTPHRTPAPQADLVEIFSAAIGQAYALGASPQDMQAAAAAAFARRQAFSPIVFVSSDEEYLLYYTPFIENAVSDLHIEVKALLLDQDSSQERGKLSVLRSAACIVTLVRGFVTIKSIVETSEVPLVMMALELSEETKRNILDLDPGLNMILIAEERNLFGLKSSVEQYLAADKPLECVPVETADLRKATSSADLILHSLASKKRLESLAGPRKIEIHFVPDKISLERVRACALKVRGSRY